MEICMRFKKLVQCKYLALDHCDKQEVHVAHGDVLLLFWSNVAFMFWSTNSWKVVIPSSAHTHLVLFFVLLLPPCYLLLRGGLEGRTWSNTEVRRSWNDNIHSLFPSLLSTFMWHCNFFLSVIRFFFSNFQGFHESVSIKKKIQNVH